MFTNIRLFIVMDSPEGMIKRINSNEILFGIMLSLGKLFI